MTGSLAHRHRSAARLVASLALILAAMAAIHGTHAQGDGRCLDNTGERVVPPGVTYQDAGGRWICAPGEAGTTAGGWKRVIVPTAAVPDHVSADLQVQLSSPSPGLQDSGSTDKGARWRFAALAALAGLSVAAILYALYLRSRREPLQGWLTVVNGETHREIDLSAIKGPALIGSKGKVHVAGQGVAPRHAVLSPGRPNDNGRPAVLRPLSAPVAIERAGRTARVSSSLELADGDIVHLGAHRIIYRNLAQRRGNDNGAAKKRRNISWCR
ncbi:MAG: FHA domain-containing protein [Bacillota bacterium]|nr:FHA domain-containing protein [Bacillota bacterium]